MEMIESTNIEALVRARADIEDRAKQIVALWIEAREIARVAHLELPRVVVERRRGTVSRELEMAGVAGIMDEVDRAGWWYLIEHTGLMSLMDAEAREEFQRALQEGEIPTMTKDVIIGTFGRLYNDRAMMFRRGVVRLFRRLSWDYKSNLPQMFGRRIIIRNLNTWGYPSSRRCDDLDDLMRALTVLDGKPEPAWRGRVYAEIRGAFEAGAREVDNGLVLIRWFKNTNGHIYFRRPDLVDQLNQIIAEEYPDALPAPRK